MTEAVIVLETVLAAGLAILALRESWFLHQLRQQASTEERLWLLDALAVGTGVITIAAVYLSSLGVLAAFGIRVADAFPQIRAVNGAVLLAMIAVPYYLGHEMRRRRNGGPA